MNVKVRSCKKSREEPGGGEEGNTSKFSEFWTV